MIFFKITHTDMGQKQMNMAKSIKWTNFRIEFHIESNKSKNRIEK